MCSLYFAVSSSWRAQIKNTKEKSSKYDPGPAEYFLFVLYAACKHLYNCSYFHTKNTFILDRLDLNSLGWIKSCTSETWNDTCLLFTVSLFNAATSIRSRPHGLDVTRAKWTSVAVTYKFLVHKQHPTAVNSLLNEFQSWHGYFRKDTNNPVWSHSSNVYSIMKYCPLIDCTVIIYVYV